MTDQELGEGTSITTGSSKGARATTGILQPLQPPHHLRRPAVGLVTVGRPLHPLCMDTQNAAPESWQRTPGRPIAGEADTAAAQVEPSSGHLFALATFVGAEMLRFQRRGAGPAAPTPSTGSTTFPWI